MLQLCRAAVLLCCGYAVLQFCGVAVLLFEVSPTRPLSPSPSRPFSLPPFHRFSDSPVHSVSVIFAIAHAACSLSTASAFFCALSSRGMKVVFPEFPIATMIFLKNPLC